MAIAAGGGCDKHVPDGYDGDRKTEAQENPNKYENDDNEEEIIVQEIYPFSIDFTVEDSDGNNLLDPETEGSITDNGIKAIFRGVTYVKDSTEAVWNPYTADVPYSEDMATDGHNPGSFDTKAYIATFYGLIGIYNQYYLGYYLSFGELDGEEEFIDETLIIDWNDGSKQDTITFTNIIIPDTTDTSYPVDSVYRRFRLNGGAETEEPIRIIKNI